MSNCFYFLCIYNDIRLCQPNNGNYSIPKNTIKIYIIRILSLIDIVQVIKTNTFIITNESLFEEVDFHTFTKI